MRARAGRQDLCVNGGEFDAGERNPKGNQQRSRRDRDPTRHAHHEAGEPEPEPVLGRPRFLLCPPAQRGRRERINARSQQSEDRRQDDQRDRGGDQRDERPADPHRVEEALRKHEQRRDRTRDGESTEQNGPPRCRHRPPHRLEARAGLRDLFAVARDDEQAVVDRQPEAQADHKVEREDRYRSQLARNAEHDHRADDRQPADEQRQRGGDQAAEEEQRQEEKDWERV